MTAFAAVVAQQFDVAAQLAEHGLMPIIEPEVPPSIRRYATSLEIVL
jgi:fructose-bisphosphate aldolase class 1